MITGTSGRISLTLGSISSPVMPGMLMSDRIKTSDCPMLEAIRDSASAAELAKSMTKRSARRSRRNCCRNNASTSGSSSTTRTRTLTSNLLQNACYFLVLFFGSRQYDREFGKNAGLGIYIDRATMLFHDDVM